MTRTHPAPHQDNSPVARLSAAITQVDSTRASLLNTVQVVESGAAALDATDAICAKGYGVPARQSYREGSAAYARAGATLRTMGTQVANYRDALTELDRRRTAVTGAPQAALAQVVVAGQAEARSVAAFASSVAKAWAQYVALDHLESTWIMRAVTPWYRDDVESSDAYAILAQPFRHFLDVARTVIQTSAAALRGPSATQSATLDAADQAITAASGG